MREISIIKQNILQYLEFKRVSKYEFYQKTGVSNGILSQSNGISEENLLRFLSYYSDINTEWLLTGRGNMIKENGYKTIYWLDEKTGENVADDLNKNREVINPSSNDFQYKELADSRLQTISSQLETIESLKRENLLLREMKETVQDKSISNLKSSITK